MQTAIQQNPSDLFRRAVVELAELPDADLASVVEYVAELKRHKVRRGSSTAAQEMLALAHARAEELRALPREQIVQRFNAAVEQIRAQVIENNTAITSDYHGD